MSGRPRLRAEHWTAEEAERHLLARERFGMRFGLDRMHRLMTVLKANDISYDAVDIEHDAAAAEFVGSVNGGNHTVPTLKFADGSTLTNPAPNEIKAKLAQLAG